MNQVPTIKLPEIGGALVPYEPDVAIRKHTRFALILMGVLVFGLGTAAAVIPIGGAVIGSGQLGVESRIKRIAHPTGGIISEIHVKDGDRVKQGQVLMRLDTTVSGINADLSGQTVEQLLATQARLTAERDDGRGVTFPQELLGNKSPSAQEAISAQSRQFDLRRREHAGIRAQLVERINQLNQQISGYRSQIRSYEQQQVLLKPERDGVRELWEKDLVTINRLNQLERTSVDLDGSIASLRATIAQTEAKISETREQDIQMQQQWRSEAATELAQVTATLNEQRVKSTSAGDLYERSLIRAPYEGIVDKLAFATIGGVIQPAEPIMEIVPESDQLLVEAAISPADIDRVHSGQDARLKFTTFSQQSTPDFSGKVTFVSAERTTNKENGASYYRVSVRINPAELAKEKIEMRPGMPVEVFISTGSRSMLSYLTKPLQDQFERAFRQ